MKIGNVTYECCEKFHLVKCFEKLVIIIYFSIEIKNLIILPFYHLRLDRVLPLTLLKHNLF